MRRLRNGNSLSYLALAAILGLIAHCGSPSTSTVEPTNEPTAIDATPTAGPPGAPAPAPPSNPFAQFSGTYNIQATKTQDPGCNFFPTFSGQIGITANADGTLQVRVIERQTRLYNGTIQVSGSYSASGGPGSVSGQITGNSINQDERINCAQGVVIYRETGSK
jgi:hypothetical protein